MRGTEAKGISTLSYPETEYMAFQHNQPPSHDLKSNIHARIQIAQLSELLSMIALYFTKQIL